MIDYLNVLKCFSEKYEASRNVDMCEICLTCLSVNLQIIRNLALEEDI
jgi:hypothetical protein